MAISAYQLTQGSTTTATSANTASVTPGSNKLILIPVWSTISAGTPAVPGLTGNSLTYVQIATIQNTTDRRLTLFRAMGSSPSSGAVTIDFSGVSQTWIAWSVVEVAGVKTSGSNGADAVVQSATNTANSATSLTVTLAAYANSNNRPFGAFLREANGTITPETGYTALGPQVGNNTVVIRAESEWLPNATDTSVSATWAASNNSAGIAIELAEAPSSNSLEISTIYLAL
jgi:hypothetical protein